MSEVAFSRLIGDIYDCINDTTRWQGFLKAAAEYFNVTGAQIICSIPDTQEMLFTATYGFNSEHLTRYSDYAFQDPVLPYITSNPSRTYSDRRVPAAEDVLESRVSKEFLQPLGITERVGFVRPIGDGKLLAWALLAGPERALFTEEEIELVGELQSHIVRAVELQQRLLAAEYENQELINTLNGIPLGVVIVDADARVRLSNTTADYIIASTGAIDIKHGEFWLGDLAQNRAFRAQVQAITGAEDLNPALGPVVVEVEKDSGDRQLLMTISRVSQNAFLQGAELAQANVAVLFISDPDIRRETSNELLGRLFGLTPSESEVVKHLVSGLGPAEIAEKTGFTKETVRSYLKKIYQKTGCSGQAEVVALVASSPAWISHQQARDIESLV